MAKEKKIMLAMMVSPESKYHDYFINNRSEIFIRPLKLYNYWAHKAEIKIKSVITVLIIFSEFASNRILPPDTDFGAIVALEEYFDFQSFNHIHEAKEKSLFFLERYQSAINKLNIEFEWNLDAAFKCIYTDTIDCIDANSYPVDFIPENILLGF